MSVYVGTNDLYVCSITFCCGEREIRTPDTLSDIPPFQGGALGHYATSPVVIPA